MEPPFLDAALLDRYLAGEATGEEGVRVHAWLDANPDARQAIDELQQLGGAEASGERANDAFAALQAKIRARAQAVDSPHAGVATARGSRRESRGGIGRWIGLVGILGIAIVAMVGLLQPRSTRGTTRTYATNTGERAEITLTDGTHVILAPHTTLRLNNFGSDARSVTLEGEAYFDVHRAGGAPFTVNSNGVTARVLGTTFTVRHYAAHDVHIAVGTGKIHVQGRDGGRAAVVLVAGNVADVADSVRVVRSSNIANDTGWVHGELVFNDVPATDVLETLTRWYGYRFRCPDSTVVRQNVTAWVSTRSSAKALLALERMLGVTLQVAGDTVTLVPQRAGASRARPRTKVYDVWTPTREIGR